MNDLLQRVMELETRVANLKDWKKVHEEEMSRWNEERQEYIATIGTMKGFRDALIRFLDLNNEPRVAGSSKETLNLTHKELTVNLSHEVKEVRQTTRTVVGKVLFCAVTELSREGFAYAELSDALKEHGWNIGQNTVAPTLGTLVRDGYLVKLESKPTKYRLPQNLKLNVFKEEGD